MTKKASTRSSLVTKKKAEKRGVKEWASLAALRNFAAGPNDATVHAVLKVSNLRRTRSLLATRQA